VDPVPDPLFFLVVPRIEPGPPDLQPRTLTTRPQRRSHWSKPGESLQVEVTKKSDDTEVLCLVFNVGLRGVEKFYEFWTLSRRDLILETEDT
jgi:hypothetical protein